MYQLRSILLDTNSEKLIKIITKFFVPNEKHLKNPINLQLISSILDLLYSLITLSLDIDSNNTQFPIRTITLTPVQMKRLIGWNLDDSNQKHVFETLKNEIEIIKNEEKMEFDDGKDEDPEIPIENNREIYDLILKNISHIVDYIKTDVHIEENSNTSSSDFASEPTLPQVEGIVTQFSLRQFYSVVSGVDERLSSNYWFVPSTARYIDEQIKLEQVSCDLHELIKTCLPNETNITSECKRLLHLSASPQTARERTTTAPCYRARRVEVEPSTGRPEKKIFSNLIYFLIYNECV